MLRLRRLHVPGGIYYVILHVNEGRLLFTDPNDYSTFASLTERCIRNCRARIHGFCWTPREVHLAVQVSTIPVGNLVQRLAGQHARSMNRKLRQHGHLFHQKYWAALLPQQSDLAEVVRHIHLIPLRAGLTADLATYVWSSHLTYMGFAKVGWVTTGTVFRALESQGRMRRGVYRQYMQEAAERLGTLQQIDSGYAEPDPNAPMLSRLMPRRRANLDPLLLERIINSVATKLHVPREAILSPSRRRSLSLARALVAWHATRNEVATLSEVAQWFRRNPSTLCVGMERYKRTRHDLFDKSIEQLLAATGPTDIAPPERSPLEPRPDGPRS